LENGKFGEGRFNLDDCGVTVAIEANEDSFRTTVYSRNQKGDSLF